MWRYEFAKLIKNRTFLLLCAALLIGNVLLVFQTERSSPKADKTAEEQAAYVESYEVFLNEMEERVEEMEKSETFSDETTFVYRNLEKTATDFSALSGIVIETDGDAGSRAYADCESGFWFLALFLALLLYTVYYEERGKGLLLLLKGTKNGHAPLLAVKLGTTVLFTALYVLLQELGTIICCGVFYGYGDLGRAIQSVPEFRNCPYRITIGTMLLLTVVIRLLTALVLLLLFTVCAVRIRNELLGFSVMAGVLALALVLEQTLTTSSALNYLYCVNPFFWWSARKMLGTYLNLNLFGCAVGKTTVSAAVGAVAVLLCAAFSLYWFHTLCQLRTESRLEKILLFLRKKTAFRWRHTSVFRFEWSKIFFLQKKGVVLAAVVLFCVSELYAMNQPTYYSTQEIAAYHGYMNRLSGKITEESLAYIKEQQDYLDGLYAQLEELAQDDSADASLQAQIVAAQIAQSEGGLELVLEQLEALKEKDGALSEKYWVDETDYLSVLRSARTDLTYWAIAAAAIVFWIGGIHAFDRKKQLGSLLGSMKYGGRQMERLQRRCAYGGAGWALVCVLLPELIRVEKIDGFAVLPQKLCDFTKISADSQVTLGAFLLLVFVLRILSLLAVAAGAYFVSKKVRDEMTVDIIGIGAVLAVLLVFLGLGTNLPALVMRLLCGQSVL